MYIYSNTSLVGQWLPRRASVKMAREIFFLQLIFIALVSSAYGKLDTVPLPTINLNEWWGPGTAPATENTTISNFTAKYNATMVSDLISRLQNHRPFTPPLEDINFEYGFNSEKLIAWINYTINSYPFEERMNLIAKLSHYSTSIQGLNIHFVRSTSTTAASTTLTPLLLIHSWPGSFLEFNETIQYLHSYSASKNIALDIIIPSIPGYAYSDGAVRPGCGADKIAVILRNLMVRLGYSQFYVHGGDVGSMIAMNMATLFPSAVLGFHSVYPLFHTPEMIFRLFNGYDHPEEITTTDLQSRVYPSLTVLAKIIENIGYIHMQSTKPDAFGEWLNDSPSALLAHILITNGTPTATGTNVTAVKNLDNFMLYWYNNCVTTAMRLYAETFNLRYIELRINEIRSPVPVWVLQPPDEKFYLPTWLIKKKFPNVVNETLPTEGGHYYAWTYPDPLAKDIVNSLVAFNNWHTVNSTSYDSCSLYIDK